MSNQSSDQRSYSVDEMMERLRDGEREKRDRPEGEMVTRPDGTQVVRVRKRKRRSHQPKVQAEKVAKKQRKSLAVIGSIAIVILLVLAVAALLLLAKYNSKGFQQELEARIAGNVGTEVELKGFSVTPLNARAKSIALAWGEERFLKALDVKDLTADVGIVSLLGADWSGDGVVGLSGRLKVGQPSAGHELRSAPEPAKAFDFQQFQSPFFSIEFGDLSDGGALLKNADLTLRKSESGLGQVILLRGGILDIAGWMPLKVDNGTAVVTNGSMELVSLRAAPEGGTGEALFKSVDPIKPQRPVVLSLTLTDFPLSHLAGKGMEALVGGVVKCEAGTIHLKDGTLDSADIRVEFSGKDGFLDGFPFLESMRSSFSEIDYLRPQFESVHGVYRRTAAGTELQNLEMEQGGKDVMKVRGSIRISGEDELSGRLEVGLPESKVMTATGRKRNGAFSDPQNGFCWVSIDLMGTIKDPDDNYKVLLGRAAKDANQRRKGIDSGGSRFDELTQ